ncbi:hypothetical protein C0995_009181 [Termitomyces sp. Mi166|nr:hypothetical protein C0995_009181 [Termitomyces sp. Mi166\
MMEMIFMCKKCKKAFRKDMSAYEESDEYCPHCDNHYVLEAKTPQAVVGVEGEDARVDNRMLKDDRVKTIHTRSIFAEDEFSDRLARSNTKVVKLVPFKASTQFDPFFTAPAICTKSSDADVRNALVAQVASGNVSVKVESDVLGFMARIEYVSVLATAIVNLLASEPMIGRRWLPACVFG